MTALNLEPLGAPRLAYGLLFRVAKALATATHGVIVDPQVDTIITPAGTRRLVAPRLNRAIDVLELSWFSSDDSVRTRDWLAQFVQCLAQSLPEALPVRYGPYEPPQHKFQETGIEHFVDFLADEYLDPSQLGFAIWYPRRPVLGVNLALKAGPSRLGWRSHRITVDVEASMLQQPGWSAALQGLWRRIAHLFRAFYADARTLRNYRPKGGTVDELLAADRHPVCSSFWAGIPRDGGLAVALGEPYLTLWPRFQTVGEHDGNLVLLCEEDWTESHDVFSRVGDVPESLALQSSAYRKEGRAELGPCLPISLAIRQNARCSLIILSPRPWTTEPSKRTRFSATSTFSMAAFRAAVRKTCTQFVPMRLRILNQLPVQECFYEFLGALLQVEGNCIERSFVPIADFRRSEIVSRFGHQTIAEIKRLFHRALYPRERLVWLRG